MKLNHFFKGNNGSNQSGNSYYNYYTSNNMIGAGAGLFVSSRFGSGIDARRKLNIMQHQHQQFASMHLSQHQYNQNVFTTNLAPNYYQQQQQAPASSSSHQQSGSSGFGSSRSNAIMSSSGNTSAGLSANNNNNNTTSSADLISSLNANSSSSLANQTSTQAATAATSSTASQNQAVAASLASQFAASQILTSRKDFLAYTLSLMRAHTNEHRDSLPSIDISLLKHAAYVFDGIMFYMRCNLFTRAELSASDAEPDTTDTSDEDEPDDFVKHDNRLNRHLHAAAYLDDEEEDSDECMDELYYFNDASGSDKLATAMGGYGGDDDDDDDDDSGDDSNACFYSDNKSKENDPEAKAMAINVITRDAPFFRRSSSTLCLGGEAPDPFYYSLDESIPLATKPHLLQPHVRIQDMFRVKSNNVDQFMSLSKIGLMSSSLRHKSPYLKGPFTFGNKRKHHGRTFSSKKFKKTSVGVDPQPHTQSKASGKFLTRLEKRLFKLAALNHYKEASVSMLSRPSELIDRWRLTVDLFGRVFCDDVGLEPGSIIRKLGGFQLKEAKFRREMERLRNIANRELLMEVERDRHLLLQMTFKSLNNMYNVQLNRRAAAAASLSNSSAATASSSSSNILPPPLCLNRIKVTFKDEQGEGSGVARSYYTAFSEAVLADTCLPSLDAFYNPVSTTSASASSTHSSSGLSYVPFNMLHRYRNTRGAIERRANQATPTTPAALPSANNNVLTRASSLRSRDSNTAVASDHGNDQQQQPTANALSPVINSTNTQQLSVNASPFYSPLIVITSANLTELPSFDLNLYNSLDVQSREYGQQLFTKISSQLAGSSTPAANSSNTLSSRAAKITGMLLELRTAQIQQLINSDSLLKIRIEEANSLLSGGAQQVTKQPTTGSQPSEPTTPTYTSTLNVQLNAGVKPPVDNSPLFWQPDKSMAGTGFYAPRAGLNTQARLNAFRNVGRIMAICLLQNELCPIALTRHCIKFILNRPIKWHDLAFFDSQMYESFRKMIRDAESCLVNAVVQAKESAKTEPTARIRSALIATIQKVNDELFKPLDLTFNIDLPKEEGGTNNDLVENGSQMQVNCSNMYEFVKRYAEFRMVKHVELCLQELRSGIYDVLPAHALEGLTAEDFRLLLNGVADISIHTLASYTTISDESKESNRRPQFEKWFWATLEKMSQQEKQELLFFWTGSPYLPASEEGFQPLPTVTLRPPSDQHLPTANTCINRLYLPMYSSKSILKAKLLQAIKTKTFGFV